VNRHSNTILVGSALAAFFLYNLRSNAADYDLWGYLAFGRLFWETHTFPYQDPFGYVPTKTLWVYHEWLTGVLYFPIYHLLGEQALQFLKYAAGLSTAGIIYLASRKRDATPIASLFGLFVSFTYVCSSGYAPVRAQVFTFLFFAFSLYVLETAKREEKWTFLWWLVPVQILWCNLHGAFLAGLGIISLYAIGEGLSRQNFWPYTKVLMVAGFATLINPYGIKYWSYLYESIPMPRPELTEWAPTITILRTATLSNYAIYFFGLVFVAFLFILWYRKYSFTALLILTVTAYLGFKHLRHTLLFMLAFGVYMPEAFSELFSRFGNHRLITSLARSTKHWLSSLAMLTVTIYFMYSFFSSSPLDLKVKSSQEPGEKGAYYPVGALDYMESHQATGNVLPLFRWGEYIVWTFYPRLHVGMDARYEMVYPSDYCEAYFDVMNGRRGWRDFLGAYKHERVLVEVNSRIDALLQEEPAWVEAYRGPTGVLFVKGSQSQIEANTHGQ